MIEAALLAKAQSGGTPISVNVAATSLCDADFVDRTVARVGGEGTGLLLEITAAAALADLSAFAIGIKALRGIGVRVCLDDLGAAPATLECMRAARFDQVKLAGTTLRAAAAGERGRRLITALVALATTAGAETVGKMIETLPQAWLLQELGVRYGQGWLFGAPGPLPQQTA